MPYSCKIYHFADDFKTVWKVNLIFECNAILTDLNYIYHLSKKFANIKPAKIFMHALWS